MIIHLKNYKSYIIKMFAVILILFIFVNSICIYAKSSKNAFEREDNIVNVLYLLSIIDDKENLDKNVTRAEFAKMIVKSSKNRNKIVGESMETITNDVTVDNIYAGYIKEVLNKSYMITYVDGNFKPDRFVTYDDLSRAMLKLLSYTNEDFSGNKVTSMNLKYKSLDLDCGITKTFGEVLTKKDIIYGIYNTLKSKIKASDNFYGLSVFDKLKIDVDGELNADELIEGKLSGPIFTRNIEDFNNENYFLQYEVYINGIKSSINELDYDIGNYGYAILYFDNNNKILYSYTEREDISSPIRVLKGYVNGIYYSANNITTPYRVDIDLHKYYIENEDMKFAFSSLGTFKENDYIVYMTNKMNDVSTAYIDENGDKISKNDDIELYDGSIINAFNYYAIK